MPAASPRPHLHYIAGLDGIRAFAVLAVITFHSGFSWLPGGFYGVDAFFVLSGFLITSLLVTEWRAAGTIALGRFWAGRARRLLPALFALVTAIGLIIAIWPAVLGTPHLFPGALSTIFYSANWYFTTGHANYFATVSQPSPLLHTWSLAIEEQFYLLWPLVVLAILRLGRKPRASSTTLAPTASMATDLPEGSSKPPATRRYVITQRVPVLARSGEVLALAAPADTVIPPTEAPEVRDDHRRLERLFIIAALGALAASLWMAVLAPQGSDSTRAYFGTDTRAQGLLVGAALAAAFARWGAVTRKSGRQALALLAVAGAVATGLLWTLLPKASSLAFSGGFLLAALASAAVIAGVVQMPRGPVPILLSWSPLRALGRISYGVYLWYWPVLLVVTNGRTHLNGVALFIIRVAVTITIAALSYRWVEQPIRRGAFPSWRGLVAAPAAAGAALLAVLVATLTPIPSTGATAPLLPQSPSVLPGPGTITTTPTTPVVTTPVTGRALKVLLVGDSVAGSLGVGLSQQSALYGVQLINQGAPGCSLAMDQQIKVLYYTLGPGPPCRANDPNALLAQWKAWVDAYNPDVVVYLARGELFDTQHDGRWSSLGQGSFDNYVGQRFERGISILGAKGAPVVVLTSPYYNSGEQPTGARWPEDNPQRVTLDNFIISAVVARANAIAGKGETVGSTSLNVRASVFDLGSLVSPGGAYVQTVGGVATRCSDGVHFTPQGGDAVAARLLPRLLALGRAHQVASPHGSWPGPLPPPVPTWYAKLGCR